MALDSDDLNKRKAQREKLKKQRLTQQKQLRTRLIIAAAVLLACGVLIYIVRRNASPPDNAAAAQAVSSAPISTNAALAPSVQTEPVEPTTVIHFAAAGDLNVCDEIISAGGSGYDYRQAFLDVLPLLSEADLTTINFEGNLIGAPYGTETVSAPQELLTALADAGVDLVQLANSKTIANGISGLTSTLQAVKAAGLEPLGAYESDQAFKDSGGYTIREVNGVRIAIVAFTKGMDNMALPDGNESCVNLLYTDYSTNYQQVDRDGITRILRAAAEEEPDITIALLHWGSEYNDVISKSQTTIKELLLSEGVDAIIGTHPHYVQAMEFDPENGTFVCYSLGDFFGSAARSGTEYSVVLDLEITKDNETGDAKITDYSYTPIYTIAQENAYRVVRLQQAITEYETNYVDKVDAETYESMVNALSRVEARVTSDS